MEKSSDFLKCVPQLVNEEENIRINTLPDLEKDEEVVFSPCGN